MKTYGASMKDAIYLETTVVSYYTSRPSRDIIALAHQEITREWWPKAVKRFDVRRINGGMIMWEDPIVAEVRKAGEKLAEEANYNLHTFFKNLRKKEIEHKSKIVTRVNNKN